LQISSLLNVWSYEGMFVLYRKVSKLSITFVLFISLESAPNSVRRVL
jgi:hypothetical protein